MIQQNVNKFIEILINFVDKKVLSTLQTKHFNKCYPIINRQIYTLYIVAKTIEYYTIYSDKEEYIKLLNILKKEMEE